GEVERDVEIAVDEAALAIPLEHLFERLDGVALDLAEPDLVHLLEHEQRIADADVAERGGDLAGLRAGARTARADELALAAAAELEAGERPAESASERAD